jgi:hypothetical protein
MVTSAASCIGRVPKRYCVTSDLTVEGCRVAQSAQPSFCHCVVRAVTGLVEISAYTVSPTLNINSVHYHGVKINNVHVTYPPHGELHTYYKTMVCSTSAHCMASVFKATTEREQHIKRQLHQEHSDSRMDSTATWQIGPLSDAAGIKVGQYRHVCARASADQARNPYSN